MISHPPNSEENTLEFQIPYAISFQKYINSCPNHFNHTAARDSIVSSLPGESTDGFFDSIAHYERFEIA